MSQVVTLEGFRPAARYDGIAWTIARIEEATTDAGPWTEIESITLDPVDTNPAHPQLRSLTTELASDGDGLWYRIVFFDDTGDASSPTEPVQNAAPAAGTRDICTIADVLRYAPGYSPATDENSDQTLAVLQAKITSESYAAMMTARREFTAIPELTSRTFDIGEHERRRRTVWIGDLATVDTVTWTPVGGSAVTIAAGRYTLLPRNRDQWQPYTRIWFPPSITSPVCLAAGDTITLEGTWGFPTLPPNLVQAVAMMVVFRYVNDIASQGTAFAEAFADVNLGAMFAAARDTIESFRLKPFRG